MFEAINDRTTLIDTDLFGIRKTGAAYLIRGREKTCLIDAGTAKGSKILIDRLDELDAFAPDIIVLTHSHYDHSQGAPTLRREAVRRGKSVEIYASRRALPNLADQSWNRVFDPKHAYEDVPDVRPLDEGDVIDLGDVQLEVLDFAGHCDDDIALLDRAAKTVFVGDAIGYKVEHTLAFPPFMPPFWSESGFLAAIDKVRTTSPEVICLAHFGALRGDEAASYPDLAVETMRRWWTIFEEAEAVARLDDVSFVKRRILDDARIVALPEMEVAQLHMRAALGAINLGRKLARRRPIQLAELQMEAIIGFLIEGFRSSRAKRAE